MRAIINKTHLKKALQRTSVPDRVVRLIESSRGIRYPATLIGRLNLPPPPHMPRVSGRRIAYVHAIEGGHVDHDMTGLVVQEVSARLYYPFRSEILRKARPVHLLPRLAHFTRLRHGRLRSLLGP